MPVQSSLAQNGYVFIAALVSLLFKPYFSHTIYIYEFT